MLITFRRKEDFEGWDKFPVAIQELISAHSLKRVCEIGAGANPTLSREVIQKYGLHYTATDESEREVAKSGTVEMAVFDICAPDSEIPGAPYDLIMSRMVAEHFRDSATAYKNMFKSLAPGGLCVHSFATLYTLPFVFNRLLPDFVSGPLMDRFGPRNRDRHNKFKAYYSHCRGPVGSQIRFFRSIGYEVVEYRGYFGHSYYKLRLPFLHSLEEAKKRFLLKTPIAHLTSYATAILRRPEVTRGQDPQNSMVG